MQVLDRGDGSRRSLHASTYFHEHNEDLVIFEICNNHQLVFSVACWWDSLEHHEHRVTRLNYK